MLYSEHFSEHFYTIDKTGFTISNRLILTIIMTDSRKLEKL